MTQPHGGEVWDYDPRPIDFSANINPLGPSKSALRALKSWKVNYYPPPSSDKLKREIAGYIGVKEDRITLGNGSVELIKDFCSIFLRKSDTSIILEPTFSEYERHSRIYGKRVKRVFANKGLEHSSKEVIAAFDDKTRIVFICRPNNPTGSALTESELEDVIEAARRDDILVFLDEAFIEFSDLRSYAPSVEDYPNLFVLRSFTKFYALPGLRLGFGIGTPGVIKKLEEIKSPWNVNIFAHDAALASLKDNSYAKRTKRHNKAEKAYLKREIERIGIKVYESHANFLLLSYNWNSKQVKQELLKEGLLIRDCSTYHGLNTRFIRISPRTRKDNLKLLAAIKKQAILGVKKGKECNYYPCHFEGQDCSYCFCPFYPCEDENLGSYIRGKNRKVVWTCKNCRHIHEPHIVKKITAFLGDKEIEGFDMKKRLEIKDALS
jgi:histidinol-phosphate aminotransferase